MLNNRLKYWANQNNLLCDEQNGFRKGRTCNDHLCTLTNSAEYKIKSTKFLFVTFIDFSKTYDRINRNFLRSKLQLQGLAGQMLNISKAIYRDVLCCVRINVTNTDWFQVTSGLNQGCLLSPLLFNMYVNDLVHDLTSVVEGINMNDEKINCMLLLYAITVCYYCMLLLYAADLVLLAESEEGLQRLLDVVNTWCNTWGMKVNSNKSKVVHFRGTHICVWSRSTRNLSRLQLPVCFYLGLFLNEFLDFAYTNRAVAKFSNKALGLIICKAKAYGGMRTHVLPNCTLPLLSLILSNKGIACVKYYVANLICYIAKYYPFYHTVVFLENVNVPQARHIGPSLV